MKPLNMIIFYIFIILESLHSSPMEFKTVSNGGTCVGGGCQWVSAEGEITKDTPKMLDELIQNGTIGDNIVFNSPGGDLLAGLELGRILRKHKMKVSIGRTVKYDDWIYDLQDGGICASACAFAFLGATDRSVIGNELGFHQFYDEKAMKEFMKNQFNGNDRMRDQYLTGLIVEYLQAMDADIRLYSVISKTPPNKMHYLSNSEIEKFEINTDALNTTPWTLKAYDKGLVAEFKTRDIHKKIVRLYSTKKNKYYFTVIWEQENIEWTYESLKDLYSQYNLVLGSEKKEYKIIKSDLYLSKNKKRMSIVFQISKKTAEALGRANSIYLNGYHDDGSELKKFELGIFSDVNFDNIAGDKRLPQIAFKNSI